MGVDFPDRGNGPEDDVRIRLRAALTDALRVRDKVAVLALRSALSAIANAEAVGPAPDIAGASSLHMAGAVAGLGAGETQRRTLTAAEAGQIVQAEISERLRAARDYESSGHAARAQRLRAEADVLAVAVSGESPQTRGPDR
jgi:hypothetical protein